MSNDTMLDTRQAASHYGLSASFLNKLRVVGGGCPYAKIGKRVLYRTGDFDRWIATQMRISTSDARLVREPEDAL